MKAIWSPPLSQANLPDTVDAEVLNASLQWELEHAVNDALAAVVADDSLDHVTVEVEKCGPEAEGPLYDFIATVWTNREQLAGALSILASAAAVAELVGRVNDRLQKRVTRLESGRSKLEISFTPEALAACCLEHAVESLGFSRTANVEWEVLEPMDDILHPSERLQYLIRISEGSHGVQYRLDATGTVHDVKSDTRVPQVSSVIPDVSLIPVAKPVTTDHETGERRRRWPTQDGRDRSSHIAVAAILNVDFEDPETIARIADQVQSLNDELKVQLESSSIAALEEVVGPPAVINVRPRTEYYQVGPASEGLTWFFISTFWESREQLAQYAGWIADSFAIAEVARRTTKKLRGWIVTVGEDKIDVSVAFPPEVISALCESHAKMAYHKRAKRVASAWYCLTSEFYGGYQSPAHPTGTVEYLVIVRVAKRKYLYRVWGTGEVTMHAIRSGHKTTELPIPDLLSETSGSWSGSQD